MEKCYENPRNRSHPVQENPRNRPHPVQEESGYRRNGNHPKCYLRTTFIANDSLLIEVHRRRFDVLESGNLGQDLTVEVSNVVPVREAMIVTQDITFHSFQTETLTVYRRFLSLV